MKHKHHDVEYRDTYLSIYAESGVNLEHSANGWNKALLAINLIEQNYWE